MCTHQDEDCYWNPKKGCVECPCGIKRDIQPQLRMMFGYFMTQKSMEKIEMPVEEIQEAIGKFFPEA